MMHFSQFLSFSLSSFLPIACLNSWACSYSFFFLPLLFFYERKRQTDRQNEPNQWNGISGSYLAG